MILVFKFFHIDHEMLKMFWILRRLWLLCSSIHLLLFSWRMLRIVSVITHSTNTRWLHNIKQARNYFIDKKNSERIIRRHTIIFDEIPRLNIDTFYAFFAFWIIVCLMVRHDGRLGLRLWQPVTRGQQHHCPVQCHSYLGGGRGGGGHCLDTAFYEGDKPLVIEIANWTWPLVTFMILFIIYLYSLWIKIKLNKDEQWRCWNERQVCMAWSLTQLRQVVNKEFSFK